MQSVSSEVSIQKRRLTNRRAVELIWYHSARALGLPGFSVGVSASKRGLTLFYD